MQAVGASFPRTLELNSFFPQDGYRGVTQVGLLSASSRKSTDISLVTAEGDKVTISAQSALQAGLVSYDYRGRLNSNEASLQGRALQVSAENALAISVEGDLSKEELADIKKLVEKIEKLGADFFSRPLEDSLSRTLELSDFDSIASFEANLRYAQQLTVAQVVQEESRTPAVPLPAPSGISLDTTETTPSAPTAGQLGSATISTESVQEFIKKLLDEVKETKVDEEKAAEKLPQFLTKLFKKLAKEFEFDEPKLKLADHIQQKVAQGLKQSTEKTPILAAA
jgi:hypothetical protein